jgi:hypothetical protein
MLLGMVAKCCNVSVKGFGFGLQNAKWAGRVSVSVARATTVVTIA